MVLDIPWQILMNVSKVMVHAMLMQHVPMRMAVTPAAAIPVSLEVGNNVQVSCQKLTVWDNLS